MPDEPRGAAGQGSKREYRRVLVALVVATLTASIVAALGVLLLPDVAVAFDVSVGSAQWMLTCNLLVGAVSVPTLGRLADGSRPKRVLLVTLGLVLIGCLLSAAAPSFLLFLLGRALQGCSYALVPVCVVLVRRMDEPGASSQGLARGVSAIAVTASTGVGLGYPLTGLLATWFDFRSAFWVGAVFVFAAMALVIVRVPRDGVAGRRPMRFDYAGALSLGLGLASLLVAVSEGHRWGWASLETLALAVFGVLTLAAWVIIERRVATPLVNFETLRFGEVILANATALGLGAAMWIGLSVVNVIAQAPESTSYGLALSPLIAGFVMLPLALGSQASSRVARLVSRKVSLVLLMPAGVACVVLCNAQLLVAHSQAWQLALSIFLFGLGIGVSFAAMPALISSRVPTRETGSALGLNQVLRLCGSAVGSSIAAWILGTTAGPSGQPSGRGVDWTLGVSTGACLVVLVFTLMLCFRISRSSTRDKVVVDKHGPDGGPPYA